MPMIRNSRPPSAGNFDCRTGSSISRKPPRNAPVIEVTPQTTASSSSSRPEIGWKSSADTVPRSPASSAPPSPAMPDATLNSPTRNQRWFSPSVPHAAGLSRIAISTRPIGPRRSASKPIAITTNTTIISTLYDDRAAEVVAEQRHPLRVEAAVEAEHDVGLEDELVHQLGERERGQREVQAGQAQHRQRDERADARPR